MRPQGFESHRTLQATNLELFARVSLLRLVGRLLLFLSRFHNSWETVSLAHKCIAVFRTQRGS